MLKLKKKKSFLVRCIFSYTLAENASSFILGSWALHYMWDCLLQRQTESTVIWRRVRYPSRNTKNRGESREIEVDEPSRAHFTFSRSRFFALFLRTTPHPPVRSPGWLGIFSPAHSPFSRTPPRRASSRSLYELHIKYVRPSLPPTSSSPSKLDFPKNARELFSPALHISFSCTRMH
jgi:hypothetical protein